jgi:hypothetical protein
LALGQEALDQLLVVMLRDDLDRDLAADLGVLG